VSFDRIVIGTRGNVAEDGAEMMTRAVSVRLSGNATLGPPLLYVEPG